MMLPRSVDISFISFTKNTCEDDCSQAPKALGQDRFHEEHKRGGRDLAVAEDDCGTQYSNEPGPP